MTSSGHIRPVVLASYQCGNCSSRGFVEALAAIRVWSEKLSVTQLTDGGQGLYNAKAAALADIGSCMFREPPVAVWFTYLVAYTSTLYNKWVVV